MEVDIFVHGVPNGFRYWGDGADKDYFETFYNESAKEIMFQIQTRKSGGNAYCYYHYLAYNNVVAHDGRAGSYFGLSLRIDAFYKDALNIYRMLDILYNTYIVGDILQPLQGKMKYSVPDFAPISSKLDNLEKEVVHFFEKTRPDNYLSLQGFPTTSSKCFAYNLLDCTSEIILGAVKQNGVVVISPYYERKSEQDLKRKCEEEIKKIKSECEASLNSKGSELKKAQDNLAKALQEKDTLEQSLANKTKELKDVSAKIDKQFRNKKIEEIIAPIQRPINQLAEAINELRPAKTSEESVQQVIARSKRRSIWSKLFTKQFLFSSIAGIILLLILLCLYGIRNDMTLLQSDVNRLKFSICPTDTTIQITDEEVVVDNNEVESADGVVEETKQDSLAKQPRIDIQSYNGSGYLKIGLIYDVSIDNCKEQGDWVANGAQIKKTKDPQKIKLLPKDTSVTISYKVSGRVIKSRTVQAKKSN